MMRESFRHYKSQSVKHSTRNVATNFIFSNIFRLLSRARIEVQEKYKLKKLCSENGLCKEVHCIRGSVDWKNSYSSDNSYSQHPIKPESPLYVSNKYLKGTTQTTFIW